MHISILDLLAFLSTCINKLDLIVALGCSASIVQTKTVLLVHEYVIVANLLSLHEKQVAHSFILLCLLVTRRL